MRRVALQRRQCLPVVYYNHLYLCCRCNFLTRLRLFVLPVGRLTYTHMQYKYCKWNLSRTSLTNVPKNKTMMETCVGVHMQLCYSHSAWCSSKLCSKQANTRVLRRINRNNVTITTRFLRLIRIRAISFFKTHTHTHHSHHTTSLRSLLTHR